MPPATPRIVFALLAALASAGIAAQAADREAEVRARGADVMPFSLAATQHVFDPTADGGVQRVLARPGHPEQVAPIRDHLRSIAQRFSDRDFAGPSHIHGDAMPGLSELKAAGPDELQVAYRDLPDGAEVAYHATTPALVDAIHRWFAVQLSDHGHDAMTHHHGGS